MKQPIKIDLHIGNMEKLLSGKLITKKAGEGYLFFEEKSFIEVGSVENPYIRKSTGEKATSLLRIMKIVGQENPTLALIGFAQLGIRAIRLDSKGGHRFVPLQREKLGLHERIYSKSVFIKTIQECAIRRANGAIQEGKIYGEYANILKAVQENTNKA